MEKFLAYLEKHKAKKSIVGIVKVTEADMVAMKALPQHDRRPQLDAYYQDTKQPVLDWLKANGGKVVDKLEGTADIIVSGSYAFWQKMVKSESEGDEALTNVTGFLDNDTVAIL